VCLVIPMQINLRNVLLTYGRLLLEQSNSESLKYRKIKIDFTQIFNDLVMIIFTLKLLKHVNQVKKHFVITSMCTCN